MALQGHHTEINRNRRVTKWQKRLSRIVIFLSTASIVIGLFYLCHYLTKVMHSKENTLFFSGEVGGYIVLIVFLILFGLILAMAISIMKRLIVEKSLSKIKQSLKVPVYLFGILFTLTLPFLVLAFDNYLVVTNKNVYYSQFWTLGEKEYSWEKDVSHISIHYLKTPRTRSSSGSVNYKYFIHFNDGNRVDVWESMWSGSIENIKLIDEVALQHQIPFKVESRPSDEGIIGDFQETNLDFAKELFSR